VDHGRFDEMARALATRLPRRAVGPLACGLLALVAGETVAGNRPGCRAERRIKTCRGRCGRVRNNCGKFIRCNDCDRPGGGGGPDPETCEALSPGRCTGSCFASSDGRCACYLSVDFRPECVAVIPGTKAPIFRCENTCVSDSECDGVLGPGPGLCVSLAGCPACDGGSNVCVALCSI
jgi:hypothetical protein